MVDVTIGRLGTLIERRGNAFLKSGVGEAARDLAAEHERLLWLDGKLPVPRVLAFDGSSMLISAIAGVPAHESRCSAQRVVEILADALRLIHAVPIDACPFRDTLEHDLREAETRMREGKINRDAFVADGLAPLRCRARSAAPALLRAPRSVHARRSRNAIGKRQLALPQSKTANGCSGRCRRRCGRCSRGRL